MKADVQLPKYVIRKTLSSGRVVYYYNVPTWARKRAEETGHKLPVDNEVLGPNVMYVIEKATINNRMLDAWRTGEPTETVIKDSIDEMIQWYKCHPKYVKLGVMTKRDYTRMLETLAQLKLPNAKKRLGQAPASRVAAKHADQIYEIIKEKGLRTSQMAMSVYRRMWGLAVRADVFGVKVNPFEKMDVEGSDGSMAARPATYEELLLYLAAADAIEYPEMGDAALIAFELLQRVSHVRNVLLWSDYTPKKTIIVEHPKTGAKVEYQLVDKGEELFPELEERLSRRPRHNGLIISRMNRVSKCMAPIETSFFRKVHIRILTKANLPGDLKFSSFRKGGFTLLGNCGATDAEIMASSGHRTRDMVTTYTKRTAQQVLSAVRKRRMYLFGGIDQLDDDEE